ncbi:MAG: hypothetical protein Q7R47_04615, partial [Candidatus Diapherotrites archaeon]|nr:hypothetical protein [Candidatus Diapherotrites archaeon]
MSRIGIGKISEGIKRIERALALTGCRERAGTYAERGIWHFVGFGLVTWFLVSLFLKDIGIGAVIGFLVAVVGLSWWLVRPFLELRERA